MIATCFIMVIGIQAIAASPDENPSTAPIKESLQAGKAAIKAEQKEEESSAENESSDAEKAESEKADSKKSDKAKAQKDNKSSETSTSGSTEDSVDSSGEASDGTELPDSVSAIGDSVMLGAAGSLQENVPGINVDARESRQMSAAFGIVSKMKKEGTLGDVVVIGLGTNGTFEKEDGQKLIKQIGEKHQIYWVLTYGKNLSYQNDVNKTIKQLAKKYKTVSTIDWPSQAAAHPEWLYGDGIHLNSAGQQGYAQMIKSAISGPQIEPAQKASKKTEK